MSGIALELRAIEKSIEHAIPVTDPRLFPHRIAVIMLYPSLFAALPVTFDFSFRVCLSPVSNGTRSVLDRKYSCAMRYPAI